MRAALPFALLLLAPLVSGCAWLDRGPDEAAATPAGDAERANIENRLDAAVETTLVLTGPSGQTLHDSTQEVDAGQVLSVPLPARASGDHQVSLRYTYDADGKAGSGRLLAAFDPSTCARGVWIATFTLVAREGGVDGHAGAVCEPR